MEDRRLILVADHVIHQKGWILIGVLETAFTTPADVVIETGDRVYRGRALLLETFGRTFASGEAGQELAILCRGVEASDGDLTPGAKVYSSMNQ